MQRACITVTFTHTHTHTADSIHKAATVNTTAGEYPGGAIVYLLLLCIQDTQHLCDLNYNRLNAENILVPLCKG